MISLCPFSQEHELELSEKKIDFLEKELANAAHINDTTEESYNKLQHNQKKILDENSKLHRELQEAYRALDELRGGR